MNKKILSIISLIIILSNPVFATTDSCSYKAGSNVWRCSNNSPGISIEPGQTANLTFYCCYAGPGITNQSEYNMFVNLVTNYTTNEQQEDYSWEIKETIYNGSYFIKNIYYNEDVFGDSDIPIIVEFEMPEYSPYYEAGKVIYARTDVNLKTGGTFVLNNVIQIRIVIPLDWKAPIQYQILEFLSNYWIYLISGIAVLAALIFVLVKFVIRK